MVVSRVLLMTSGEGTLEWMTRVETSVTGVNTYELEWCIEVASTSATEGKDQLNRNVGRLDRGLRRMIFPESQGTLPEWCGTTLPHRLWNRDKRVMRLRRVISTPRQTDAAEWVRALRRFENVIRDQRAGERGRGDE